MSSKCAKLELSLVDNGSPETGLRSYTLKATGPGITALSKFTIDGEVNHVFDSSGNHSEWIGDGSTSETEGSDSHVIFGNLRIPDVGGATWDYDTYPDGSPSMVTEETVNGGGNSGMGTLNNYDDSIAPIWDSYMKIGSPSAGYETVELMQLVVADGNGFSIDLTLWTSTDHDEDTGNSTTIKHNLSLSLPSLQPGDADGDGNVDADDAAILAKHWLQSGTWADGDFNRDGAVNDSDAAILAANWAYASSGSVPEPGALILLAGMALAAIIRYFSPSPLCQ